MKRFKLCISATTILLLLSITISAADYDFICDNIYYQKISSTDVAVSSKKLGTDVSYSGNVIVPATVTYAEKTYNVTSINQYAFYNCRNLQSIKLPEGITSINTSSFYNCSSLTSINIPNTTLLIDKSAFANCTSLKNITIGSGVRTINSEAFYGCSSLTSIICLPETPPLLGPDVFNTYCTLKVKVGSKSLYANADGWNMFTNIEEAFSDTKATSLELSKRKMLFMTGDTKILQATASPELSAQIFEWVSSDQKVATVSDTGVITAITPGDATITATTTDGSDISASCAITVYKPGIPGDVDGDGEITMGDANAIVNIFLNQ